MEKKEPKSEIVVDWKLISIYGIILLVILYILFAPLLRALELYPFYLFERFISSSTFILIVLALIYFIPAILGRHKKNFAAIFALNLLLGWTFIGWVIALVWALVKEK